MKFARDTQRARLAWIRAKMFTSSSGGVTERNMAIDVSEEICHGTPKQLQVRWRRWARRKPVKTKGSLKIGS
jgi:hypothetical protein